MTMNVKSMLAATTLSACLFNGCAHPEEKGAFYINIKKDGYDLCDKDTGRAFASYPVTVGANGKRALKF